MSVIKNLAKIILGILLVIIAFWIAITYGDWGKATIDLIQGGIILAIIFIGLIFFMLGITDLKND
ncbi:MAG: hypothetical protein KJ674_02175 [Nanoarchaeota archaeon]|nr:hypothetical protein [Nanoarchaeota archaeon]